MKKVIGLLLFVVVLIGVKHASSQDVIKLKNGKEFNAIVINITNSKVKYRKYENSAGPILRFRLKYIKSIQIENDTLLKFDFIPNNDTEIVVVPKRTIVSPSSEFLKGYKDGRNQFCNYKLAANGTFFATMIAGGIPGLAPAIGCGSVAPSSDLLQINSNDSVDYINGYIAGAKSKKATRIWMNWGIGYAVHLGVIFIAVQITESFSFF